MKLTRRGFVSTVAAATAVAAAGKVWESGAEAASVEAQPICVFSKHLQWTGYEESGRIAASLGLDGLDLTVRPGGHVLPERVEEDLPRAVEEIRRGGSSVPMMTTAINDPDDERTEAILKTASQLGIKYYRMGYYHYDEGTEIEATLAEAEAKMRGLARLNEKYGMKGDYQNHAGRDYFGASLWDLRAVLSKIGSGAIGVQFDLRHATVEGSQNWPVDFRAVADSVHSIVAKDFRWKCVKGEESVENVALGQGISDFPAFFRMLQKRSWRGPISLHLEYPLGGADQGKRELTIPTSDVIEAMKRDLGVLKDWLREEGLRG